MSAAGSLNFFWTSCASNFPRAATAPAPKWPLAASRRFNRRSTECVAANLLASDAAGLDVGMGIDDVTRLRIDGTRLRDQVRRSGRSRISGPPVYRTPVSGRDAAVPAKP